MAWTDDNEHHFKMARVSQAEKVRILSHVALALIRRAPGMEITLSVEEMVDVIENKGGLTFVSEPSMEYVKFYLV